MQNIGTTLTPGVATPFPQKGTVLQILSSGNSAGLTIQFMRGSQVQDTVNGVLTGWKLTPQGGFDGLTIQSATGDTISGIVTGGDVDVQVLETVAQITNTTANPVPVTLEGTTVNMTATNVGINNTSANPVPVSIVNEPGAPFAVSGTVGISGTVPVTLTGSTDAAAIPVQAQPMATTLTEPAPVAVATAGAVLLAASATRKAFRVRNAGTGLLALTASAAQTFANAAIVLNPGDTWNETDAPGAAWYAVSDVGTTANLQVLA